MLKDDATILRTLLQLQIIQAELEVALFELKRAIEELESPYLQQYGREVKGEV